MDTCEIKQFIAEKVAQGYSLSQIQDLLNQEKVKLTFMELRLIASEIETEVFKAQEAVPAAEEKADDVSAADAVSHDMEEEMDNATGMPQDSNAGMDEGMTDAAPAVRGKTTVTVSPIQRPGFHATGTVSFGSGVTAEWFLDQTGRLGLDNVNGGKPDQQDVIEFQEELKKAFGV